MKVVVLFTLLVAGFLPNSIRAEETADNNWSHWRGHHGNGISLTASPPTEWSDTKNVKWKVAVPGRGYGSPVIWENRVFITSAIGGDDSQPAEHQSRGGERRGSKGGKGRRSSGPLPNLSFEVFCFDRETGKQLWKQVAVVSTPHEGTHSTNTFASASPCTDGERVYAHFGSRGLFCYTIEGKFVWSRTDFGKMTTRNVFGEGSSPTLYKNMILVPWDHEGDSALHALNKLTGETIWQTERDEPTCWATPLVVQAPNGKAQVIMNGQNNARAYDVESGEEIWRCGGQTQRPVASPVFSDGISIIGSGFRGSFIGAFKLDGSGDIEGSEQVVWTTDDDTPDIASPLLSQTRLYFYKGKTGILSCLNATTGEKLFGPVRIDGVSSTYASPIAAGGHVYLTGRSGTTVVIKDTTSLKIVATNSVGEGVDATPAPVGNQLFIRGEKHLFCISE